MRILAIDDNQDNLTALRAVVSDRLPEAEVLTALNGPAGLDLARAQDPDVILLDIVMPGMDGYAVCRQLKQDPALQAIPVLFLTANRTDRASRIKALQAGAEGFLSKPFDDLELTAQIRSMVKIKAAVNMQRTENERLAALVAERTRELVRELDDRKRAETARHASERALRESEERFRSLFERAPLGYQSLDADGRFIEVNEAWLEALGYAREEVVGKWFGDFLAPECVEEFRERFPAFKAKGRARSEFHMLHKSGDRRYMVINGRIGHNSDGSFKQTHCILADRTERKQAEEALRASEARLQRAQEIAHVGDWELSIASGTIWGSAEAFRIYGLEHRAEGMPSDLIWEMIDTEDQPRLDASLRALLQTQCPYDEEYRIVRADDGAQRVMHSVASLERDTAGAPLKVVGTVQDVTEHKQAQAALQERDARLRDITSSMGDWVWETDENGVYIYSSQKSLDLLGVPHEDVIGKTPFDFMPADEAERVAARFSEIVARKAPIVDLKNWVLRENGERICILTNGFPILDAAGDLRGYRGVDRDITKLQEAGRLRRLSANILTTLNEPTPFTDTVRRIFAIVKQKTGLQAVGLRLRDGDDFPYFSQDGFSDEFVQAENALARRDANGNLCRDADGSICLECTCGLVISGKADLTNPLFTKGGSFCTNDASLLLQLPADQDPRHNPRSRCIHDGCASMALIPIRANQEIVGLLQLSDRRSDRLSSALIQSLEGTCASIGMALMRNQAQERLRASEQSYRNQFAMNSAVMLLIDSADGAILDANTTALAFYGYPREQLLSMRIADINTLPAAEVKEAMRSVPEEQGGQFQFQHRLADGSVRDVGVSSSRIQIGERTVLHSIITDVTERKRAAEKLRASDELLRRLSAQIPGVIYQYQYFSGGRSCFPFASEGVWDIYEVTPQEIREDGTEVFGRMHLADRDRVIQSILDSRDHLTQWACEFRVDLPTKGVRWIRGASNPQKQEDGSVIWHGYATDITEQKQVEAEREELQEQLQQAQKMDAVGQLAGGIAHDFNNMLEVIIGHTEFALDDVDPTQPLHADLREVLKAARRSADLTRQLLTFARKQAISPEILDLNDTVDGVLSMLRRLIGENIDLDWHAREGLWPVMMDLSQVDQILANLCVNSRDAIADVGAITIRLENAILDETCCSGLICPAPGEYVVLSVSDNGCGMDEETIAHVFEPFFTTKELGKGTGLGLATVYGIVQQNAGGLDICSEPGQGTTFAIYLPRHVGAVPVVTDEVAVPAQRGTETILVVEDQVAILKMAKKMLENRGYTVLAAASPGEATSLFAAHTDEIDLLVTDVIMPEMNGQDLATQLASLSPRLKCLFMSGYTADVIAHHGVLEEGVHFIQKPFSIGGLAGKVREVLDENQGAQ